jgi:hypothetical protein
MVYAQEHQVIDRTTLTFGPVQSQQLNSPLPIAVGLIVLSVSIGLEERRPIFVFAAFGVHRPVSTSACLTPGSPAIRY